jgi:hypothetical protein
MFLLPYSPEALRARVATANVEDGEFVQDMLIYRGGFTIQEYREYCRRRGLAMDVGFLERERTLAHEFAHFYTCRHHQADGLCGVYEQRPNMCRGYPYRATCRYEGCAHPVAPRPLAPLAGLSRSDWAVTQLTP